MHSCATMAAPCHVGRRSATRWRNLSEQVLGYGDLGQPVRDIRSWLTTFAPILISFSLRLVSDQTLIGSGVDSGHRFYFDKATDGVNRNENKPYAPAPATQPAIAA